jgi:hypothetical protein
MPNLRQADKHYVPASRYFCKVCQSKGINVQAVFSIYKISKIEQQKLIERNKLIHFFA